MAKLGISIKIDVKKILKERLFQGAKGTYVDLTTFIDTDNVDQYDNNGFISQSVSKDERDQGVKTPILGNCKVFFNDSQQSPQQQPQQLNQQATQQPPATFGNQPQHQQSQQFQQPQDSRMGAGEQQRQPAPGMDDFADDIPF